MKTEIYRRCVCPALAVAIAVSSPINLIAGICDWNHGVDMEYCDGMESLGSLVCARDHTTGTSAHEDCMASVGLARAICENEANYQYFTCMLNC